MNKNYQKSCPKCGEIQKYTTKNRLNTAIKENWNCNKCSISHQKKIYDTNIINEIVNLYKNGFSFTKIASTLKMSRNNVKKILIECSVWVENRDQITKKLTQLEIDDIIKKYSEGMSTKKISEIYNISVSPIKRILKEKNLLKKGNSNGKKIIISDEDYGIIKNLYLNEYENSEYISNFLGFKKSFIDKILHNSDFRRNRSDGNSVGLVTRFRGIKYNEYLKIVDNFKKYKNDVIKVTKRQPIHNLLNYEKRGNSGVDGAYHLDHKYSILEGFKNNISPNIIGDIKNLEFISWEDNIKKRNKCSITINELITK